MRTLPNLPISQFFTRYEVIEGAALPQRAVKLNWANINQYKETPFIHLCSFMDDIRREINRKFVSDMGKAEVGLKINAGFRCLAWELEQGRSGNSQHTIGAALDVVPTGCSRSMAIEIIKWLYDTKNKTYRGGLAIKYPTPTTIGFVHFDNRTNAARWTY